MAQAWERNSNQQLKVIVKVANSLFLNIVQNRAIRVLSGRGGQNFSGYMIKGEIVQCYHSTLIVWF